MKKIILVWLLLVVTVFGRDLLFNSIPIKLNSNGLNVGDLAPEFSGVTIDLEEVSVGGKKDKIQVIAFVPSIDTGTCQLETIEFNKKIAKMKGVHFYVVSKDLPFALDAFCKENSVTNIQTVSDYKDANNALRYGTTISAPVMFEGLFARAVYVVNKRGQITYVQFVPDIAKEPNYDAIEQAVKKARGGY